MLNMYKGSPIASTHPTHPHTHTHTQTEREREIDRERERERERDFDPHLTYEQIMIPVTLNPLPHFTHVLTNQESPPRPYPILPTSHTRTNNQTNKAIVTSRVVFVIEL